MIEHDFAGQSKPQVIKVFIQQGRTLGSKPNELPWIEGRMKNPKELLKYLLEEISLE